MTQPNFERFVFVLALVLLVIGGSLYLAARAPSATLGPSTPSAEPVVAPNSAPPGTPSASQPKITWSATSTVMILSPGDIAAKDFTFASNQNLQNVVIEAVPEIAGFLSIQPNTFATVTMGQPQSVHISFSIPAGATLGACNGTIHLRVGIATLPQTMKIAINAWPLIKEPTTGLAFLVPPLGDATRLAVSTSSDGQAFVDFQLQDGPTGEFVSDLGISIYSNPAHLNLIEWFHENIDVDGLLAANRTFQHQQLSDGADVLVFSGAMPEQYLEVGTPLEYAFRLSPQGDRVLGISQSQVTDLFGRGYSQNAILDLEIQILGTVRF